MVEESKINKDAIGYATTIIKLRNLSKRRSELLAELSEIESGIDVCLSMAIFYGKKKSRSKLKIWEK